MCFLNALKREFPSAGVFGWSFIYGQSIWQKVQSLALSKEYK
jgi:hypothetical protein